ncbi:MAG: nuclear transport factor 2 family protein [Pseudomonadota bacterium]
MATPQENTEILKTAIASWHACKGGDYGCWLDVTSEDMVLRSLAQGEHGLDFTRKAQTRDDFLRYMDGLTSSHEMNFYRADSFVAERDMVVAIGATSWTTKATGKVFDTPYVLVARFADKKIVELSEYYDTAQVAATLV